MRPCCLRGLAPQASGMLKAFASNLQAHHHQADHCWCLWQVRIAQYLPPAAPPSLASGGGRGHQPPQQQQQMQALEVENRCTTLLDAPSCSVRRVVCAVLGAHNMQQAQAGRPAAAPHRGGRLSRSCTRRALFQELESRAQGAGQAETTVRELALLNQLFSVQVVQQAEQIEVLYRQVRRGHAQIMPVGQVVCTAAAACRCVA